jgi:hypothetical protein
VGTVLLVKRTAAARVNFSWGAPSTPYANLQERHREVHESHDLSVRAWVSEHDHELVKLEAEAIDNLRLGLADWPGCKGARLSFLCRTVNGEVWLPAVASYTGSARMGLVVTLRRSGTSEYSGYRKYSVDTLVGVGTPK